MRDALVFLLTRQYRSTVTPEPGVSTREVRLAGMRRAIDSLYVSIDQDDELSIMMGVGDSLGHLYGLWERLDVASYLQVEWARGDCDQENLVGLVWARGEADHHKKHVSAAVGYGDAPYGLGPYGGGWLWWEFEGRARFRDSEPFYREHILWEPITAPLERAHAWLERHAA